MSEALRRLGEVSRAYESKANEYIRVCDELAQADAAYTRAKARFKVQAKLGAAERVSDVELENRAHADDEIAGFYAEYLRLKFAEKSLEQKLRQLKTQNDNGRSALVQERETDKFHGLGITGAA